MILKMASPNDIQAAPTNNQTAELDLVEQLDQDYFCPVSLELLIKPHQTSCCGHHISQQAANRLTRERKPCPMCKEDNLATHEDKFFTRNFINKLKVYCSHKKSGCEWTGELGGLNHHTTACPKRPWKCQYCDYESIYEIGPTDHTPNCANYPLPCPNQCEIGILPRCQADSHLLECSLQLVECEFAGVGCAVKVPRRDLAGHMTENAQHHLMTATLLNLRFTRELHQKMEEKDQQILELKQQLTEQKTSTNYLVGQCDNIAAQLDQQKEYLDFKLSETITEVHQEAIDIEDKLQKQSKDFDNAKHFICHKLTLSEFKKCQAKGGAGSWFSEPFYYPGGYRFKLNIDTNGCGETAGTHLSAYLYLLRGDYDDERQWPIKVTVRLTMLNQLGDNNHHTCRDIVVKYEKAREEYKCINKEYYALNGLQSAAKKPVFARYLYNDSIKFKLELKLT
ncbi:TNF receptor-associated factor 5-like [Halichondria panicea]|uniref:TNF receptor-associated factor 5-like n=1 Tax=Halichondria panicea TaxID=6063 RepID=UPI00312B84D3